MYPICDRCVSHTGGFKGKKSDQVQFVDVDRGRGRGGGGMR